MKHPSKLLSRIMLFSSLLIGIGLLGCYVTLSIASLQSPALVGLFAGIAVTGCIGFIVYSVVYVIEKIRDDKKR